MPEFVEDWEVWKSRQEAEEIEELSRKNRKMLDDFEQFLRKNFSPEKGSEIARNICEFVDINDFPGSHQRVKKYIDSVMEQHAAV